MGELRTAQQQTHSSVCDHSWNDEIFEEMETVQGWIYCGIPFSV